jgi:hypothetical protein
MSDEVTNGQLIQHESSWCAKIVDEVAEIQVCRPERDRLAPHAIRGALAHRRSGHDSK